jgi:small subunit ribosomal protein S6e
MNIVIAEPKSGRSANKKTEEPVFLNRRIGEEVNLDNLGLPGFKAKITGGSDKQGFPMKPKMQGTARKKALLKKGIGFRTTIRGQMKRKNIRGNIISPETQQLNLVITQAGDMQIFEQLIPKQKIEEKKETIKEQMVKQSLENVGNTALAKEAKKIKSKSKR